MTTPESTLKILTHAEKAQGQKSLAEQAGYSLDGVGLSEKVRLLEKFVERKHLDHEELAVFGSAGKRSRA